MRSFRGAGTLLACLSLLAETPSPASGPEMVTVTANMTKFGDARTSSPFTYNPFDWDRMMHMQLSVNEREVGSLWVDLDQSLPPECQMKSEEESNGLGEGVLCSATFPYDIWGENLFPKDLTIRFYDKDRFTADDLITCQKKSLYLYTGQFDFHDQDEPPYMRITTQGRKPEWWQYAKARGIIGGVSSVTTLLIYLILHVDPASDCT